MSYTTLYKVTKNDIYIVGEFQNAYRFAYNIWQRISQAYFFEDISLSDLSSIQKVWDIHLDRRANVYDRIVMMTTFDKVMVKKENFDALIDAFSDFSSRYPDPGSLPEQIEFIKELKEDETCIAICWQATSVTDSPWHIYEDDEDDYRGYDLSRDEGHWFLFDKLNEMIESEIN